MTEFDLNIIEGGWAHEEVLLLNEFLNPLVIPLVIGERRCYKCHNVKPLDAFYRSNKKNSGGFSYKCIVCDKKDSKLYRNNNKEKLAYHYKKYRKENKNELAIKKKQYRILNRDKINEKKRETYYANRDYYKQKCKEYYTAHKEQHKLYGIEWKRKNKEKVKAMKRKERSKWTQEEFEKAKIFQNNKCVICGLDGINSSKGTLSADHDHYTGGIRALLCNKCNSIEGFANSDPKILRIIAKYIEFYDLYQNGPIYVPFNPELLKTAKEEDFSTEVIDRVKAKYKEDLRKEILLELSEKGVDISGII